VSDIRVSRSGAVCEIEFARPAKKNAFTHAMYEAMSAAIVEAERDDAVRVVLLRGQDDVFTAGNDIEDFVARPPANEDAPVFRFLRAASVATKPFVAAVNGPAIGIGTTLLLHCDLVYAGEDARFRLPFTSLGVVPEFASSYLLPLSAGYHRAAELLLLGEPFDAHRAFESGFVTRVVPAGQTLQVAREAAAKLAALPARAVRLTKALLKAPHATAIASQLGAEGAHFHALLAEPAAREALTAFLEKRKPDFRDL
jgi:enoyl-CoA hydratase/carnithine racemase